MPDSEFAETEFVKPAVVWLARLFFDPPNTRLKNPSFLTGCTTGGSLLFPYPTLGAGAGGNGGSSFLASVGTGGMTL
jgi:hypothetical protein